jgi:hypothetical protein
MFHLLPITLAKKIQLIPNGLWKFIYQDYMKVYLEAPFAQDTLKNFLQHILKELKISNSNVKGLEFLGNVIM